MFLYRFIVMFVGGSEIEKETFSIITHGLTVFIVNINLKFELSWVVFF